MFTSLWYSQLLSQLSSLYANYSPNYHYPNYWHWRMTIISIIYKWYLLQSSSYYCNQSRKSKPQEDTHGFSNREPLAIADSPCQRSSHFIQSDLWLSWWIHWDITIPRWLSLMWQSTSQFPEPLNRASRTASSDWRGAHLQAPGGQTSINMGGFLR